MEDGYWPDEVPLPKYREHLSRKSLHHDHVTFTPSYDFAMDAYTRNGLVLTDADIANAPTVNVMIEDARMKISDALRKQQDELALRIAEAEAKEAETAIAMSREPELPMDSEDCPVIYWTRELEVKPARQSRQWVRITDAEGRERNVQEIVDQPAEMKTYTYVAFRSVNGLWYQSKLGEANKTGVAWAKMVEDYSEIRQGRFWIATGWTRPEEISE